jgi:endonuclease YncB( thermonuclease family)
MATPRFYPIPLRLRLRRWLRRLAVAAFLVGLVWLVWRGPTDGGEEVALGAAGSARAIDGDSLELTIGGRREEVRIDAIDAPEMRQTCTRADGSAWPCGIEAMASLAAFALEPGLTCTLYAEDRYQRGIATCRTARTPDIGAALVARGMAVATGRGSAVRYLREEARAEARGIGLWQGEFVRPADWRAAHPR